jgi:hypothetical protein
VTERKFVAISRIRILALASLLIVATNSLWDIEPMHR